MGCRPQIEVLNHSLYQLWVGLGQTKLCSNFTNFSNNVLLCMGAQASIVPEPFSWLSRVASFAQRREPIPPVSVGRVAMNQSHACILWKVFIVTYLSFKEVKPRVKESRCFYTQGSEAVLKVQLQRRVGKNHV